MHDILIGVRRGLAALLTVVALAYVGALPAIAQEIAPEHLALARKYVDLTDQSKIFEISLLQAGVNTMQTLIRTNPSAGDIRPQITDSIARVVAEYAPKKSELLDQFARLYALRFTMDDLTQIVAFYESDVGKKLVVQNVEANQDLKRILDIFQANLRTEFFAKVKADLKANGIDL